jgi:hypothetical protein
LSFPESPYSSDLMLLSVKAAFSVSVVARLDLQAALTSANSILLLHEIKNLGTIFEILCLSTKF